MCFSLHAQQPEISEPKLWKNLYNGNFSLSQKMILLRKTTTTNDAIMNQFMLAYVFYRNGRKKQMTQCFKGVDNYIEHYYYFNKEN